MVTQEQKEQILENYKNALNNLINASATGNCELVNTIKGDILYRISNLLEII